MSKFTVYFQYLRGARRYVAEGKRTVRAFDAQCAAASVRAALGSKWYGELFTAEVE